MLPFFLKSIQSAPYTAPVNPNGLFERSLVVIDRILKSDTLTLYFMGMFVLLLYIVSWVFTKKNTK